MKRHLVLTFLISCIFFSLFAQPQLVEKVDLDSGKIGIPYEKYKLSNGLTVLLHQDHSDPVVNVLVTYKVGSNREDLGKSGFAHFFEHMMFQGSKHVADEEHFKIIQSSGGQMNGSTDRDLTVYYETVPSNYLEMALWLEADRMGFLLDSLTEKKFENQRDAVENEKSQNVESQPYALGFVEEINKILYPPKHPYSWPVIGYTDELDRATIEDVKNFFLRWYGPNNAILTVAGDFDKEQTLKWIDTYFGSLKSCPEVKKLKVAPVILPQDKYGSYRDKVYMPLNLRVYPTVPQYHRDDAALDLLADMLGSGQNSLLYKNFVKNEKAAQATASHSSSELISEFQIQVIAYPPDDFNYEKLFLELDKNVKSTLDEFEKTGITDEALARVKAKTESDIYSSLDDVSSKATLISEWERLLGKPYTVQEEIERYNKVTKEDILRVFNKYIKGSGAAILNTYPILNPKDSAKSINPYAGQTFPSNPEYKGLTYNPNPDNFDRSVRPMPGKPKTAEVPDSYQFSFANGIKVIGTSYQETPFVNIYIDMDGGELVHQNLKKIGLASMTARMLNESTKNYSSEQMESKLDKMGSNISFSAGKTNTTIFVTALKRNLDSTLKMLQEKLFSPAFKEEDFKRIKKQTKAGIKQAEHQPQAMASKVFNYILYGETLFGLSSSVKSVDKIELQDIKDYYSNYYTPSLTKITIVGYLSDQEAKQKLELLNHWSPKNIILPAPPDPKPQQGEQFFIYDINGAPSSVITMGYTAIKFEPYGDFYKNRIANFVFGGNFNSRLNLNLREEKGYTYGIGSFFSGDNYKGEFMIFSSVKRKATAPSLVEITKELKKYNTNGITDQELEYTKKSLLNQEAIKYESSFQKLFFLANIITYNLDNDYTVKQNEILKNITKEEVNAQITKYIKPDNLNTIIVGDKIAIEAQLRKNPALSDIKLKKITLD